MVSRRIIRTKILHILYAHYSAEGKTLKQSEAELNLSIKKTHELYLLLFMLLIGVRDFAARKIEAGRRKNIPTESDLNPNTRFIDNRLITLLENSEMFSSPSKLGGVSWANHKSVIRRVYNSLTGKDFFKDYMSAQDNDYLADKELCELFFIEFLVEDELFFSELEEQSIYWNDDLNFAVLMVLKTLKRVEQGDSDISFFAPYKDEEDERFTVNLLRKVILKHGENRDIVESYTKNWDVDRVALMDILIMELAITELTEFPSIPIKVTLNEYIELAKYYSTSRSSNFINGILDRVSRDFKESGKITKRGRGLCE